MEGTVKFFNPDRGFGFIVSEETGNDVFFHITNLAEGYLPEEGDIVNFELGQGRDGRTSAKDVLPHFSNSNLNIKKQINVLQFEEQHIGQESGILIYLDQGFAPNAVIIDILSDISILNRLAGGSGINFKLENILKPNLMEA